MRFAFSKGKPGSRVKMDWSGDRMASNRQEIVAGTEVRSDKGLNLGKWQ